MCKLRYSIALLCAVLATVVFAAIDGNPSRNSYDQISDSLSLWSRSGRVPAPIYLESASLRSQYPDSVLRKDNLPGKITIELPLYLRTLRTSITLPDSGFDKCPGLCWSVPIRMESGSIWVDDSRTGCACNPTDLAFAQYVADKLGFFRTSGMAPRWQIADTHTADQMVVVRLLARDVYEYRFSNDQTSRLMRLVAAGNWVYSGLLDVSPIPGGYDIVYYILVTHPGARRHHYFEWSERSLRAGNRYHASDIAITFIPGVRTDNLENLFFRSPKDNSGSGKPRVLIMDDIRDSTFSSPNGD